SFRGVLTSLLSPENKSKVIIFTSPHPQEGKTTVISNLAVALAEIDRKVLLIDADLRQPRLHTVFGVTNAYGLSDLISQPKALETLPIASLSKETSIYGLRLLPSGPGAISIPKVLYSTWMDKLFDRLRQEYDMVLIDTPPMMTVPDARILARKADAAVLVLRSNHTTKSVARAAVERLIEDGTPILGTVLNDWSPKSSKSRNHYNGFYYYDDQDARKG
ncbi:MAG TPA: CpsD/CapB family tyrosine-protein kinase, partial [Bryobacteraceae bacterium]|nr:CpsD/CapB family tyrosine-protein kinase [Bryobacteraceae bacterium]